MLIQLGSSEAQASFTLLSLCPSPPIITTGRRLQGTFPVQDAELSSCTEDPHGSIMGSFFQQKIYCRQMVPRDSTDVPCPCTPAPTPQPLLSPSLSPQTCQTGMRQKFCPCKSKLERSLQEYHRRNPSAVVITSVRFFVTLIRHCRILALWFSCCSNMGRNSISQMNS